MGGTCVLHVVTLRDSLFDETRESHVITTSVTRRYTCCDSRLIGYHQPNAVKQQLTSRDTSTKPEISIVELLCGSWYIYNVW